MDQNEQFLDDIKTIVHNNPDMRWPSAIMSKIEPVKKNWWQLFGWEREVDQQTEDRLTYRMFKDTDGGKLIGGAITRLVVLFINVEPVVSIKRKRKDGTADLYFLRRFGRWYYVGFKTVVKE
ncbi:MAG TPA: hypothetical protein VGB67_10220 [Fibrella sp.]|jgi:hypothetical protein